MKEIKNVTSEIEKQAYENVKGFDITKLCYNSIFNLLDNNNVFYNAVNDILKSTQPNNVRINLESFSYSYVEEMDGKPYPKVDLFISVTSDDVFNFVYSVSPFNAKMEFVDMIDIPLGNCDNQLTKIWHTIMKGIFKERWIVAYKKYLLDVKNLRDVEIQSKAELERLKNEQKYNEEINSI